MGAELRMLNAQSAFIHFLHAMGLEELSAGQYLSYAASCCWFAHL